MTQMASPGCNGSSAGIPEAVATNKRDRIANLIMLHRGFPNRFELRDHRPQLCMPLSSKGFLNGTVV